MRKVVYYNSSFSSLAVLDSDVQAFIDATEIVDGLIIGAINTLVADMKSLGIWSKMIAIYPLVGGTVNTHKFNLIDPRDLNEAHRLSFFGGVGHSPNGIAGDGSSGYVDTNISASSIAMRGGYSCYIHNNIAERRDAISARQNTPARYTILDPRWTDNRSYARWVSAVSVSVANTDSRGFYGISRIDSTTVTYNVKGVNHNFTGNDYIVTPLTDNLLLLSTKEPPLSQIYSSFSISFATFHEGMNNDDLMALYNIITSFQITLGRNF